jgi:hypothetical protein
MVRTLPGFVGLANSGLLEKIKQTALDSLQSFPGFHFTPGIIARSAASPGLTKNQPIGP